MNNRAQGAVIALALRELLVGGVANRTDLVESICWAEGVTNEKVYTVMQALEALGIIGVEAVAMNPKVWWR